MKCAWYVVVVFEKENLPTLLIGPRTTEKEINDLATEVRMGHHVPRAHRTKKYQWGTVRLAGIKA